MPDDTNPVELVNQREKVARKAMSPQVAVWQSAIDAFLNKRSIDDPYAVNITVGRLIGDVETVLPRDVNALLGMRPYMPIRARKQHESRRAKGMERLGDHFTDQGQFFLSFSDALRLARPHGIAYVEPRWTFWPVNITQRQQEFDRFGRLVGYSEFNATDMDEGLEYVVHDPWAVRPHPYGNTLRKKPSLTIVELVPQSEVERLLDMGTYKLERGVTRDELKHAEPHNQDWLFELRREKSGIHSDLQGDIGLLMRHYEDPTPKHPSGRWIHTWNRTILLLDDDNQYTNMPLHQKPVVALRNVSHIGPDRYWPIGMYQMGRDLAMRGDHALSLYFDDAYKNSARWVMFNPDLIHPEDLTAEGGSRIPVDGGRFDDALRSIEVGVPTKELFDLYDITKGALDQRLGLFDYQRGSTPLRKETATATMSLTQAGNTRMEYGILLMEQTSLQELAYLTVKLIDANMTDAHRTRLLGPEEAVYVQSADPDTLDGGFIFDFQGSDRVQRQAQRNENLLQTWNLVGNDPALVARHIFVRKLLQRSENFSDEEIEQMVPAPEEQGLVPQPGGPPGGQGPTQSVGQQGAIAPPGSMATPATNMETQMQA